MAEMRVYTVSEVGKASEEQAVKTVFHNTDSTSSSVWVVKPGQEVVCHLHSASDDVWVCTEGKALFHPEIGEDIEVTAGQVIVNPAGKCHGATNHGTEDFIFVSVVAPVPSDYVAL